MKKRFFCLSFLIHSVYFSAQELISNVISSSGEQINTNSVVLSFTVGESVVSSDNEVLIKNCGFQQGTIIVTSIDEFTDATNDFQLLVYPNPTANSIRFKQNKGSIKTQSLLIELLNAEGKIIQIIEKPEWEQEIDLSSYHNGVYYIRYYLDAYSVKAFKIIKTL